MDTISKLERYGECGWRWQIEWDPGDFTVTIHYRTNRKGDGLFFMTEDESAYSQSHGTAQWGLPFSEKRARLMIGRKFPGAQWA